MSVPSITVSDGRATTECRLAQMKLATQAVFCRILKRMTWNSLSDFVSQHRRIFVLTGAGCSTDSGIPDYRDLNGNWKRAQPVMYQAFMNDLATRQRYWARSLVGWKRFGHAPPNNAHRALAQLESCGRIELLVTQNVDRLHQAAGTRRVLDLHGRMDVVRCTSCDHKESRSVTQRTLRQSNPRWDNLDAAAAPDGDADVEHTDFSDFVVPSCRHCHGILKPDVVFFGERVPPQRVETAMRSVAQADAMLVVGSSLMVYSGFRFAQAMAHAGKPIAAVNLGRTRADDLLSLKISQHCGAALAFLLPAAVSTAQSAPADAKPYAGIQRVT